MSASRSKAAPGANEREDLSMEQPGDGAAGNIDKIRDIIFGSQMQEYDRRFRVLEDRLLKASADLRADLDKRVTTLESYLRKELDALSTLIKGEREVRTTAIDETVAKLATLSAHADKRLEALAEDASTHHRELRAKLQETSQAVRDDMHEKITALSADLQREAEDLRRAKTDRADLAAMLTEMALRLTPEAADE